MFGSHKVPCLKRVVLCNS